MKILLISALAVAVAGLGGCNKKPADSAAADAAPYVAEPGASRPARYAGIGIYVPGTQWTKQVQAQQTKASDPAAKPTDDEQVIVVVDSRTGEVRSCGNLSGYCIGMNPWKTPLPAGQAAPVNLIREAEPARPPADVAALTAATSKAHGRARRHAHLRGACHCHIWR